MTLQRFWNHPAHSWVSLLPRLITGITFIIAAWPKILNPDDFAWSINMYQMLGREYINFMAVTLPWLEMITGVAIIIGFRTRAMAFLLCGMLVMFIVALTYAIVNHIEMPGCGCFSQEGAKAIDAYKSEVGYGLLIRDWLMFFAMGYVWLFDDGRIGVDGLIRRFKK
ncbi:DoxX family membrane protein [Myxococcota bacterium]|nr:DoxX family membrane protein [Myxococcota bacterium]MBU1382908.1 DoxX family membrane protein [Myxococcota bacterium]MBU1495386.1 DoxX family membrane protein [Myxococcota bacterium]